MKICLRLPAVFWCIGLLTFHLGAAGLKLFYEQEGKSVEIMGVENGKLVYLENGGRHPLESASGIWHLEGSIAENVNLVYFSPSYSVWHRAVPDGQKEDERPFAASVGVRHLSKDYNGRTVESRLLKMWPLESMRDAYVVFIWLDENRQILKTLVSRLPPPQENTMSTVSAVFRLTLQEARGQPVLLLLGHNGFEPPLRQMNSPEAEVAFHAIEMDDQVALSEALAKARDKKLTSYVSNVTLLHYAAECGNTSALDALLAAKARVNATLKTEEADNNHDTPLRWAAADNRLDSIKHLLAAKADPDKGFPLHEAVSRGHLEVVQALLDAGADANLADSSGDTPLGLAINYNRGAIAELLIAHHAKFDFEPEQMQRVLVSKCLAGQAVLARLILEKEHFNPNVFLGKYDPLMAGAVNGGPELCRVLLSHKANVNATDDGGVSALMIATQFDNRPYAEELVAGGADLHARSKNGRTALHVAAANGSMLMTRWLIDKGLDSNASDHDGDTPLTLALEANAPDVARLLLQHGAKLSWSAPGADKGIDAALRCDLDEAISSLLADGWSANAKLYGRWPAAWVAEQYHSQKTLAVLRKAGAVDGPAVEIVPMAKLTEKPKPLHILSFSDPRPAGEDFDATEVKAAFFIDEKGRVLFPQVIATKDPRLVQPMLAVLERLNFSPPRLGDKTVCTRIIVEKTFPASTNRDYASEDVDVLPKIIKSFSPVYPFELRRSGLEGKVEVAFIVNIEGQVTNPWIVYSTNPEFGAAALAAISHWQFNPGMRDGHPVRVEMSLPITFTLTN